jgi:Zn-dependent protease
MTASKIIIGALICLVWVFSISCHEFAHAIVAYWGGDKSVKERGYLTLNPFAYTSTGMTVILPAVFLLLGGFALPGAAVYVHSSSLRNRFWKSAVSFAGPAATMAVTVAMAIGFALLRGTAQSAQAAEICAALAMLVYFHAASIILNLLPMPGLDGYGVIEPWLPTSIQKTLQKYGNAGFGIILILLWLPIPNEILWAAAGLLSDLLGVPAEFGDEGFHFFRIAVSGWAMVLIAVLYLFRRKDVTAQSPTSLSNSESATPIEQSNEKSNEKSIEQPIKQPIKHPIKQPMTDESSVEHSPSGHDRTSD